MLKKSHRVFGLTLLPALLIAPLNIQTNIDFIQKPVTYWNQFQLDIGDNLFISLGFLLLFFLGTTFPDIDMKFKVFFKDKSKRYLYHRQFTHSLFLNIGLLWATLYYLPNYTNYYILVTGFLLGITTHLLADMLTGSVPFLLYGHYGIPFMRIGITSFIPKSIHTIFTEEFPKMLNKNLYILVFLNLIPLNLRLFF